MRFKENSVIILNLFIFIFTLYFYMLFPLTVFASDLSINLEYNNHRGEEQNKLYLDNETLYLPDFHVRGIYVSGWVAGQEKRMQELIHLLDNSILNTMVIDVKDEMGYLSYYANIRLSQQIGSGRNKIENMKKLLKKLKGKDIYTIARIVVFRDSLLAQKRPDLALKLTNSDHEVFYSNDWVNPALMEVWKYNIQIARDALQMGFDEIQFDYIRFPALASKPIKVVMENKLSKSKIINDFLQTAHKELGIFSRPISIDVFGLTTTANDDLGIGQKFVDLVEKVKIVSPMLYPSHYAPGSFGLATPEREPYHVIYQSIKDARQKITVTNNVTIRPWLQDFSLNHIYTAEEVKNQLIALNDLGVKEWLLWNSRSQYTEEVFVIPPF